MQYVLPQKIRMSGFDSTDDKRRRAFNSSCGVNRVGLSRASPVVVQTEGKIQTQRDAPVSVSRYEAASIVSKRKLGHG
jgi:hypothetical protein